MLVWSHNFSYNRNNIVVAAILQCAKQVFNNGKRPNKNARQETSVNQKHDNENFKHEEGYKEFSKQALLLKEEHLRNVFQKYEKFSLEICAIEPNLDAAR